jgi:hypothetical protein
MTSSKSWALVVAGHCILAAAMLAFLTINGISTTTAGTIGTAILIGLGLLLPAAGTLELARRVDPPHSIARKGLAVLSLSLIGLLIGLAVSFAASSLSGHLVSAVFIVVAGISGLIGAVFISKEAKTRQLIVGAALIAIGAALIPASNIALFASLILNVDKSIYQDIGATVAGCGSVLTAYSFFVLCSRGQAPAVSLS